MKFLDAFFEKHWRHNFSSSGISFSEKSYLDGNIIITDLSFLHNKTEHYGTNIFTGAAALALHDKLIIKQNITVKR